MSRGEHPRWGPRWLIATLIIPGAIAAWQAIVQGWFSSLFAALRGAGARALSWRIALPGLAVVPLGLAFVALGWALRRLATPPPSPVGMETVEGVVWRWRRGDRVGPPIEPVPFCPRCDNQLLIDHEDAFDEYGEHVVNSILHCDNPECFWRATLRGTQYEVGDRVRRAIERLERRKGA